MNNKIKKITYCKKIKIMRDGKIIDKIVVKNNKKRDNFIYKFELENVNFIIFPKKINCKFKLGNYYFLIGKYPNPKSKNYFIGKITYGSIKKVLKIKDYDFTFKELFEKAELEKFVNLYLKKDIENKKIFKTFKRFIEKEYNVKLAK